MLCISIMQPWAWLIVQRLKTIENRNWRRAPAYRGPLLIHAGSKPDRHFPRAWCEQLCGTAIPDVYPRGGIIGMARLVDVVYQSDDPWFCGPMGFVFADAQALPFTPLKGQLYLFEVDERILRGTAQV